MEINHIPLIAGHPALDFLNTVEGRGGPAELNYLPDYEHVLRWAERVGLVDPALAGVLAEAQHPWLADGAWAEAMELRRALDAIFRAVAHGHPPPARPLRALNATLAEALAHRRLAETPGGLAWNWEAPGEPSLVAWTIALSAAEPLTDPARRAQVKVCGNSNCDWLFLDDSPTGRRRWCRMNVCGNVAKVRRFRARQREQRADA